MANQEHLNILRQGVEAWNRWRSSSATQPDLSDAHLRMVTLNGINLRETNLHRVDLRRSKLSWPSDEATEFSPFILYRTNLSGADLSKADLSEANLTGADFIYANLTNANLSDANLTWGSIFGANLSNADLSGTNLTSTSPGRANFTGARIKRTIFADIDLSEAIGLEKVIYDGPSEIGISTIYRSKGNIPEAFLKGAGVDDTFIAYIRSLVGKPIEYYSCFISYSSKDDVFAKRLYADLQRNNVRCWFAPEDMKTGDKIRYRVDESIRIYDKLVIVLSQYSVASLWVEHEVETALGKELEGKPNVIYPIRLDQAVMDSKEGWASHIRLTRHITDFTQWKEHDHYQKAFTRLLHDLKAETQGTEP